MSRFRRAFWALGILAAFVAAPADADGRIGDESETCTHQTFLTLQDQIDNPVEEGTPKYILSLLEAYLLTCPDRIEAPGVSLRAAETALDAGDAHRAEYHFEQAIAEGVPLDRSHRMDQMTLLIETGNPDAAWALRDAEVAHWEDELFRNETATLQIEQMRDGLIYAVQFDAIDPMHRQTEMWLAVPYDQGWPVAVVLAADARRIALRSMVAGTQAQSYEHLDFISCRDRDTLLQDDAGLDETMARETAFARLTEYLQNPVTRYPRNAGAPVPTCIDTHRLFVSPDPLTGEPVVPG